MRKDIGERSPLRRARDDVHLVHDRKARGEKRDRAAGVREHVFDVRRSGERVAVVQLRDRARRVDGVVKERVRHAEGVRDRIGRRGRMDEDDRGATLQLGEDRIEAAVSQIGAVGIGHDRHPVEVEDIEGAGDLFQRPLDIR